MLLLGSMGILTISFHLFVFLIFFISVLYFSLCRFFIFYAVVNGRISLLCVQHLFSAYYDLGCWERYIVCIVCFSI